MSKMRDIETIKKCLELLPEEKQQEIKIIVSKVKNILVGETKEDSRVALALIVFEYVED